MCVYEFLVFIRFGSFSAILSWDNLSSPPLLLHWWLRPHLYLNLFQLMATLFFSGQSFFLCFILDNFCCPIFKITNLSCGVSSAVNPTQGIFYSRHCSFTSGSGSWVCVCAMFSTWSLILTRFLISWSHPVAGLSISCQVDPSRSSSCLLYTIAYLISLT